jgi:hypothetical protein
MHAIHPHLPRPILVTLTAALLTILVLLIFAARVGDISFSSSSNGSPSPAASTTKISTPVKIHGPSWLANPLAPPFQQRIPLPWAPNVRQ